ncbi:MAG: hypothetical protein ACRDU5_12210 [Mycobacterium sp.]
MTDSQPSHQEFRRGERTLLLLVAVIAGFTGILGAGVGGYFAYNASKTESRAADVRAEREERKDAYGAYFTSLDDLNDIVYELGDEFRVYKPEANDRILAKIGEYEAAWDEWGRLDDAMLLISSTEVETTSYNVTDAENVIHDLIDAFQRYMREGQPDEILRRMPEYDRGYEAVNTMEDQLFEAARKDLAELGYEE